MRLLRFLRSVYNFSEKQVSKGRGKMILLMLMISRWYMRRYKAASELWHKEMHWLEKHRYVLMNLKLLRRKTVIA